MILLSPCHPAYRKIEVPLYLTIERFEITLTANEKGQNNNNNNNNILLTHTLTSHRGSLYTSQVKKMDLVTMFFLHLPRAVFSFTVKLSSFALASKARITLHYSHQSCD